MILVVLGVLLFAVAIVVVVVVVVVVGGGVVVVVVATFARQKPHPESSRKAPLGIPNFHQRIPLAFSSWLPPLPGHLQCSGQFINIINP